MTNEYRFIGKRLQRRDARDIVTGEAIFYDDLLTPGVLIGKVLRSPHAHANILKIDAERAKELNGVCAVLTHENAQAYNIPPIMLNNKVRYVGDPVAIVAADTEAIAEKALELIDVEYEPLPAVFDPEEAIKPDAPQLWDMWPGNTYSIDQPTFHSTCLSELVMGDVEAGFVDADVVVEGSCKYTGIPNPLPPAPPGVTALWEPPNRITFWSPTQSAFVPRLFTQRMMGEDLEIRSIVTHCGGSYGSKQYFIVPFLSAAVLSKMTKKPVKIYYSKQEHMGAFVVRPSSRFTGKVGMKKDGTVTAISGEMLIDSGSSSTILAQLQVGLGEVMLAIRCKNWNVKPKAVLTNRNPSGTVRGFGGQELKAALLPVLGMAMEKLEIDPVGFFKKNYVKEGDSYFWRDGVWYTCKGLDYRNAMDKGAAAFGWKDKWKGWLKPTALNGKKRIGVGVSIHGNADSGEDPSEAYVRLNPNGSATLHIAVSECGMGQRNSVCKMAAEVLQIPLEKVLITENDTSINPFDFGLGGSRGTYAVGTAVIAAAENAKENLMAAGAVLLKTDPEKLDTVDGKIFFREDPKKSISWKEAMNPEGGMVAGSSITGTGRYEPDYAMPNFMMTYTEVEVDTETGVAELLKVVHATDVGQIIDPQALEGQLHGSLGSAGIDTALFEESVMDPKDGRILNINLMDYKWRTFNELPDMENIILESQHPTHRFKALGMGEITTAPGPSAVLMAVSNALGIRFNSYPLTPDKILAALREKGGK